MTDVTLNTFKNSIKEFSINIINNPENCNWLYDYMQGDPVFIEKNFLIEDFELIIPKNDKDKETDFKNSIILYEHLKNLPRYILTDEHFWNWINFEKGYKVALANMPITTSNSVLKDHWLFTQGKRRGLFFGVLSRCFFRVFLTVDETLDNPYELSKFIIEKPERFRNLSWRAFSSQKHIVLGAIKAEKDMFEKYKFTEKSKHFTEIAKYISQLGSVMLLDVMTEKDIYNYVFQKYKQLLIAKE
jgi:hypothetical protein